MKVDKKVKDLVVNVIRKKDTCWMFGEYKRCILSKNGDLHKHGTDVCKLCEIISEGI